MAAFVTRHLMPVICSTCVRLGSRRRRQLDGGLETWGRHVEQLDRSVEPITLIPLHSRQFAIAGRNRPCLSEGFAI